MHQRPVKMWRFDASVLDERVALAILKLTAFTLCVSLKLVLPLTSMLEPSDDMRDVACERRSRFSITAPYPQSVVACSFSWTGTVLRLVLCICVLSCWVLNAAQAQTLPHANAHSSAHVYFLTGLFGTTSHLDPLVAKVKQHGLPTSMAGPTGWDDLGGSAIADYHRGRVHSIIIVGYSTGASSALKMAAQLHAAKVPIDLVVTIDGTSEPPVPPNVRKLINLYVQGGWGDPIDRPTNFPGILRNIPVKGPNVGHFSIINVKQQQMLNYVLAAAEAPAPSPAGNGARSAESAVGAAEQGSK